MNAHKDKTAKVDYKGKTIEIELKENNPVKLDIENFRK
jgi:hypothetical protein